MFPGHPYGRSVLGTEEILNQRSPEEMRCFHRAHYQPHNMKVVITGGIPLEPTLELVRHGFRAFAPPAVCPRQPPAPASLWHGIRRQTLVLPRLEQARLLMAWIGPGVDNLDMACGMDILSALLAEGRSSRLVRELREVRQWVLDITSSFSLQRDASLFTLQAWLEPKYLDVVETLISDRLAELGQNPIPTAELTRAQRLLCNDFAFSTETPGQLAGLYGYYGTLAKPEDCYSYSARVQAHTPESLGALARQCLAPSNYAVTVLLPD